MYRENSSQCSAEIDDFAAESELQLQQVDPIIEFTAEQVLRMSVASNQSGAKAQDVNHADFCADEMSELFSDKTLANLKRICEQVERASDLHWHLKNS